MLNAPSGPTRFRCAIHLWTAIRDLSAKLRERSIAGRTVRRLGAAQPKRALTVWAIFKRALPEPSGMRGGLDIHIPSEVLDQWRAMQKDRLIRAAARTKQARPKRTGRPQ